MSKIEQIINVNTATVESTADVILVNGEVFTYKNSGLTRRVFVNADKTLIIKVPITVLDQVHNDNEAELWSEADEETRSQLAETQRLSNGYILQEFLQTLDDETTEEWLNRPMSMSEIRFATSCRNEVGYDTNGKLKCYDYDEFKIW
jgi:hypothetical protein